MIGSRKCVKRDSMKCEKKVSCLIDIHSYPVCDVLSILLRDMTSNKNIIWATDTYASYGNLCSGRNCMESKTLIEKNILLPRIEKISQDQEIRTRLKSEVFTPTWACNQMINYLDEKWFGYSSVFNYENEDHSWTVSEKPIRFPEGKRWTKYVNSRRLEIACGEAPFLVSRYDVSTGKVIHMLSKRIGILDRKLRIVNENTKTEEDWKKYAIRAFQSCYGYEWQGDSLLIARINLLMTFYEYYTDRWSKDPDSKLLIMIAKIISWNIWQMDGFKDVVPFGIPYKQSNLLSFSKTKNEEILPSKIYNWRRGISMKFKECKSTSKSGKKLFDFVIGNPPYHDGSRGGETRIMLHQSIMYSLMKQSK